MTSQLSIRRWFQFRLRTLLVFVTLGSVALGWLAVKMRAAENQARAVAAIRKIGRVEYDFEYGKIEGCGWVRPPKPISPRLEKLFGLDFFCDVAFVQVGDDVPLDNVRFDHLRGLKHLAINSPNVTGRSLAKRG
jgi:hypothetical protein